ncbi:MAG: nicotinamide-nucleotide adenylyltransferase [Candidatus Aenigmatarchaeota archaeon]
MTRGLFVGRFQPLHKGHVKAIENALKEVDELIIGIGSSQFAYTKDNPFTCEERVEMIERSVKGNYSIYAVPDTYDYPAWVRHVESLVPEFDVVYSGSMITASLFRQEGYEVKELEKLDGISSSKVRELMVSRGDWRSLVPEGTIEVMKKSHGEDRMLYMFMNYKYPMPTMTVDAIINYNGSFVLIKRGNVPFKDMYALPGGHVDKGEKVENAVIREVKEETGLDFKIKGFLGVYNEPGRDPRGYYATLVFYGKGKGELKSGDDAKSVHLRKNIPEEMAFDHKKILQDFLEVKKND